MRFKGGEGVLSLAACVTPKADPAGFPRVVQRAVAITTGRFARIRGEAGAARQHPDRLGADVIVAFEPQLAATLAI